MAIAVGESLPDAEVYIAAADGPQPASTKTLFSNVNAVVFALPGAFTPTCSARHLPGFLERVDAFAAKGVDKLFCMSVNDAFVMAAWAAQQSVQDRVTMIADGNAVFTQALGLEQDMTERGMGIRSQRFAMSVDDGVVQQLFVEPPGGYGVSSAENVLSHL